MPPQSLTFTRQGTGGEVKQRQATPRYLCTSFGTRPRQNPRKTGGAHDPYAAKPAKRHYGLAFAAGSTR